MAPHSWMIGRLDQETAAHHANADSALNALLQPSLTVDGYRAFLVATYGFEAPLEAALAQTTTLDTLIDLRHRARAGLLAADLMRLGMLPNAVAELPMCLSVPQFPSPAEALGWMYVAERASLSHATLCGHLLTQLPDAVAPASSYLEAGSDLLGARWRQFGATLDHVANLADVADRVFAAAKAAFRCLAQWSSARPDDRATGPRRAVV